MIDNIYNEQAQAAPVMETKTDRIAVIRSVPKAITMIVRAYLDRISPDNPPTPEEVQDELLEIIESEFQRHNQYTKTGVTLDVPNSLYWFAVAEIVYALHIRPNPGNSILNSAVLQRYIYAYNNSLTSCEVDEIINRINSLVAMDSKGRKDGMEERIIAEFKHDLLTNIKFECIPTTLAYDMYIGWLDEKYKDQEQKQKPCGKNTFLRILRELVNPAKDQWCVIDGKNQERVLGRMDFTEPLLEQYHCTAWMKDPNSNNPLDHMTIKEVPIHARGLFKISSLPKNTRRKSKRK